MTDYIADLAVFNAMPDTATKAEIRAAIDADRATRAPRLCPFMTIDPILGIKVFCGRPIGHSGNHDERQRS